MLTAVLYFLIGYTFFSISSAENTGNVNKFDDWLSNLTNEEICTSLKIEFDTYKKKITIHLHHWLILFFVFILAEYTNLNRFKYICLGGMSQGILNYSDWYKIIRII